MSPSAGGEVNALSQALAALGGGARGTREEGPRLRRVPPPPPPLGPASPAARKCFRWQDGGCRGLAVGPTPLVSSAAIPLAVLHPLGRR